MSNKEMIKSMKKAQLLLMLLLIKGGCFETSKPTTHATTYIVDEVVHCYVANIRSSQNIYNGS